MIKPKAIVLCGDGINCDAETTWALELAGFDATAIHTSSFLQNPGQLFESQLLALPGGFSYGDEIASGKVLAIKIKHRVKDLLYAYIDKGGLVLGICNGFQVLVQLGLLPFSEPEAPRMVTLARNAGGKFIDRWVELEVDRSCCSPYFDTLTHVYLPVRHGEGRISVSDKPQQAIVETIGRHAALRYIADINGSYHRIAALTNSRRNVLGLMPHPEAFVRWTQHPAWTTWTRGRGEPGVGFQRPEQFPDGMPHGLTILKNAVKAIS